MISTLITDPLRAVEAIGAPQVGEIETVTQWYDRRTFEHSRRRQIPFLLSAIEVGLQAFESDLEGLAHE